VNRLDLEIAALESARAFVDLSAWRKVRVRGRDAPAWLNDLLSAELTGLIRGSARRSLLLSPTGRVRAEVSILAGEDGFLLLQDPEQDAPIGQALEPYVLSSDVTIEDATDLVGLLAFPGTAPPPEDVPGERATPSVLGEGVDLLPAGSKLREARDAARAGRLTEATPEAVEAWRIRRGRPRVGVDLGKDALPHEAVMDHLIDYGKGCFLGQEAVAKVRNLGHPPFLLLAATAPIPLSSGDPVRSRGSEAGVVTSAAPLGEADWAAIVRVRWAFREAELETTDGARLEVHGPAAAT
jgi:tRNA-modifying protein YgfZ